MRRETQNVLLVLLGGAVLKISLTGEYARYVKPSLQLWLVVAGAITIALAVVGMVRDIRAGADTGDEDHHGHDHAHGHGSRSPWLLLLPALAIFLVAPPALGADKVVRSGPVVAAQPAPSGSGFVALPDEEAPLLKMSDVVTRAVWDETGTLNGRQIRLTGFVVRMPDGTVNLARLAIGCCAADAAPVKVRMQGPGVQSYQPDTWLEARGTIVPKSATEANNYVPTFEVTSLKEIPAPPDPYEF